ncbi:predicted protein [Sclerotinia sclerotiorum 1980 UF-70]|uniref:Uncharacterized protein n=2 Tax=Sclerotinia sclerotiorum (strain ATCC 18683 / 1980 / Ss-1) TaxID=665079 RepID=A7F4C0_SCLS1|nr:predicted protein [Sclerotinia sclerotiorum 1980 UF-70]APA10702.1 hypothetical protein sscle_06g054720 [Sclerotinia sclerotiorum 1980 UF-70]EDN97591.1 predicted protein [Sclerotinia sclerotiorum 1980 UF-70]
MSFPEPNPKSNKASAYTPPSGASIASVTDGGQAGENTTVGRPSSGRTLNKSVKVKELKLVQNAKRKRKATAAATTSNKRVKTTEEHKAHNAEMERDTSEDVAAGKQGPQRRKHIQKSPNMNAPVPVAPVAPATMSWGRLKLTYTPPNAQPQLRLKLRIKTSSSNPKEDETAGNSGQGGKVARLEWEEVLRIREIEEARRVLEDMKAGIRAEQAQRYEMRIQGAQQDEIRAQKAQESRERAREVQQARKKAFLARRAEEKRRAQEAVQTEKRAREARELEKRAHEAQELEKRAYKAF